MKKKLSLFTLCGFLTIASINLFASKWHLTKKPKENPTAPDNNI